MIIIKQTVSKRGIFVFLSFFALLTILSCRPEEEIIDYDYSGGLTFSYDTILFDTLFSTVGSTSKRLKVFNPHAKALSINKIYLGGGVSSPYTITVNGIKGKTIDHQQILGKDSLLLLIEVLIDPKDENLPYLVSDSILIETNHTNQSIQLVAWGQDAIFLGNETLPCEAIWDSTRPYVLYQSVLIDTLCNLNIGPGTKIYASHNAFIYIKGRMNVEGDSLHRVLFRNDRKEPIFENAPGQWGGIIFLEGSHDNKIAFANIKNAQYGIRLGTPDNDTIPDLVIENTSIENMSHSGILNFSSDLFATNTLISNCKYFTAGNLAGGNYHYIHCTFVNFGQSFFRETPALVATDNILLDDQSSIIQDLHISLINTIVYGNMDNELLFNNDGNASFTVVMANNLFKTTLPELDTNGNIINKDPKFKNIWGFDYKLDTLSPAKDTGIKAGISIDLEGIERDTLPDIGAYERIE